MMFFRRRRPLNVILFTSTFSNESTLLEVTLKLGIILRSLLIFRVDTLYWVADEEKYKDVIADVTEYALKPPYLKKRIPKKSSLRFVGLLPPFILPIYDIVRGGAEGEIRLVEGGEVGLGKKINRPDGLYLLTDNLDLTLRKYDNSAYYTGFRTEFIDKRELKNFDNLIIGDRFGSNVNRVREEIVRTYEDRGISLVIGPPSGLKVKLEGLRVNFVPNQGVKDVRTEEALISALAVLNVLLE